MIINCIYVLIDVIQVFTFNVNNFNCSADH